jgi:hypothetical protein
MCYGLNIKQSLNSEVDMEEYWAIDLDNWADESHTHLSCNQDGPAGHYARYTGTKEECIQAITDTLKELVSQLIYKSNDYGYPESDEDPV